jgi:predicted GNAT superfamily acetyltransferase
METSPWETARAAAAAAGVELRPATSREDAGTIQEIMSATWGAHDLMPPEMIVALGESGNTPYGAFDDEVMIGYVLGWAGIDPQDGLHLHSHMLAALPERRHKGVGHALKLAQRAHCLDQDIHLVRWTFDPMVARNAWLNLGKLGALADRFRRNLYGAMADELNAGERSDRLVVRWELDREPGPRGAPAHGDLVPVPRDYPSLRENDPVAATIERDRVAGALERRVGAGWVVCSFDPGTSTYLLAAPGEVPA